MKDREKEINYLIYIKSQLIRQTKKEIKELQQEKDMLIGYKKLEKRKKWKKKIPEKLEYFDLTEDKNEKDENGDNLELHYTGVADTFDDVYEKINEIIDYLDYLKSKGDE